MIYEVTLANDISAATILGRCLKIGIKSLVIVVCIIAVVHLILCVHDCEPGRVFWGCDEENTDGGHPPSTIVPGPEHPHHNHRDTTLYPSLSTPRVLSTSEGLMAPMGDQPSTRLMLHRSPYTRLFTDSDRKEDQRRIRAVHADYPADGGDGDDEPSGDDSDDDTDDDDDKEEPFEDKEDNEEDEHLASANSSVIPVVDLVPSAGDTEAFETDESAPTPRPPQIRIPFAQTLLRRARKTVRPEPPMSTSIEARIAKHAAVPTPPLTVASSPLPLPSPLTTSPTDVGAPLGYRAAGIRMRAAVASPPSLLPSTSHMTDVPEAEMPPQKRACFATPAPECEIGESSAAGAVRRPWPTPEVNTWDEIVEAIMEIEPTTLEEVDQRVTELDTTERSAAIEAHVRTLEAQIATLITQTTSLQTQLTTEPQDGPAEAGSSS
ncbi:hypothetical protein Tco_0637369 [Tanacetum coccineum]